MTAIKLAVQKNEAAIQAAVSLANRHIAQIEKCREITKQITGSEPASLIGENELFDQFKSQAFPNASVEFVADGQGKLHLLTAWRNAKADVQKPFRFDIDKSGKVILAKRWIQEIEAANTVYLEGTDVVIYKELEGFVNVFNAVLDKTGFIPSRLLIGDTTGGFKLNTQALVTELQFRHHARK
jgi:hypothetical protein